MTDELKPCPFCGGKTATIKNTWLGEKYIIIECDSCRCSIDDYKSSESTIDLWNTRPIEDELNERIVQLRRSKRVQKTYGVFDKMQLQYLEKINNDLVQKMHALRESGDKLAEALEKCKQPHYYCDDCWYSCPKADGGCCDDDEGNECNCGADKLNKFIDAAIAEWMDSKC